ncbi:hypothetical protein VB671_04305, partial [Nodularia spumigena UHCC 0040]|nr:hypothetical protein [Nodularia spumigena UHCC 0040]
MNVPLSPFSGRQESPGFRRGEVQTSTSTGSIDEAVASYRSLKGKVAKQQSLSIDEIKQALGVINDKINTLVQEKKDLLAADSNASTDNLDSSIASYRSLKGKVAKQQSLSIDE